MVAGTCFPVFESVRYPYSILNALSLNSLVYDFRIFFNILRFRELTRRGCRAVDVPLGLGRVDFVGCTKLVPVAIDADIIIVEQWNINLIKSISISPIYIHTISACCHVVFRCRKLCKWLQMS